MNPLTVILLAGVAALVGAAVGLSQEHLLRRGAGFVPDAADHRLNRLRWLAAAVAATLALKAAISSQPAVALAWLPLVLVGPWVATVQHVGLRRPDRVLTISTFLTVNGVVLATAFTGRGELLLSAALGFLLAAGAAALAHWLSGGAVTTAEVRIAALVGLACGSLGVSTLGLAVVGALAGVAFSWSFGRLRVLSVGSALLGGAWVAGTLAL